MSRSIQIILIFVGLILTLYVQAQDFKTLLQKTQQAYRNLEVYTVEMQINVYENQQQSEPMTTQLASVKKSGINFYYSLDKIEMLLNEKYLVTVDHVSQLISLKKRRKSDMKVLNMLPEFSLDSILGLYETPELLRETNHDIQYRLKQKSGSIKEVDLTIDKDLHIIKELGYVYDPELAGSEIYVNITYDKFKTNPKIDAAFFDEGKYFIRQNGKLTPVEDYQDYELIENVK